MHVFSERHNEGRRSDSEKLSILKKKTQKKETTRRANILDEKGDLESSESEMLMVEKA